MGSTGPQSPVLGIELEVFKVTTLGRGYHFIPRSTEEDDRLRLVDELLPLSTDVGPGPMIGVLCASLPGSGDIVVCGVSKFPTFEEFGRPGLTLAHCVFLRVTEARSQNAKRAAAVILAMREQYENQRIYDFTGELLSRVASSEPPAHYTTDIHERRLVEILRIGPDAVATASTRLDELEFDRLVEWYETSVPTKKMNITSRFPFSKDLGFCVASARLLRKGVPFVAILGKPQPGIGVDVLSTSGHVHGYEPVDFGSLLRCTRDKSDIPQPEYPFLIRAESLGAEIANDLPQTESVPGTEEEQPDAVRLVHLKRSLKTIVPLQAANLAALGLLVFVSFLVLHRLSALSLELPSLWVAPASTGQEHADGVAMRFQDADDQRIYDRLVREPRIVVDHLPSGYALEDENAVTGFLRHLGSVLSHSGIRARIEVHTDLSGGIEVNHEIATRRAARIEGLLAERSSQAPGQVEIIPIGKAQPVRPSEIAEDDRLANRRIVISKIP